MRETIFLSLKIIRNSTSLVRRRRIVRLCTQQKVSFPSFRWLRGRPSAGDFAAFCSTVIYRGVAFDCCDLCSHMLNQTEKFRFYGCVWCVWRGCWLRTRCLRLVNGNLKVIKTINQINEWFRHGVGYYGQRISSETEKRLGASAIATNQFKWHKQMRFQYVISILLANLLGGENSVSNWNCNRKQTILYVKFVCVEFHFVWRTEHEHQNPFVRVSAAAQRVFVCVARTTDRWKS